MRRQAPASLSSSAARGVLWTGTGQVLRQLVQIGTSLVLTDQGQVIVPDEGFCVRDFYTSLIRQNRLI